MVEPAHMPVTDFTVTAAGEKKLSTLIGYHDIMRMCILSHHVTPHATETGNHSADKVSFAKPQNRRRSHGWPMGNGFQLAIDTTLVSLPTAKGAK